MTANNLPNLSELDDWELVNSDQDLRGRPLMTRTGEMLGTIQRMLVDRQEKRVAALILDNGRTVSVEDIEIRDGDVLIDEAREMPAGTILPEMGAASNGETEVIPIVEEELAVGKRRVDRGRVMVRSRVVETPVHDQVSLRDEHVSVERRPVTAPARNADQLFEERTVELIETDEEAVVSKQARVIEEVVVRKGVEERIEQIDDSVRRTQVDVDRTEGVDRLAAKNDPAKLR